MSTIPSQSARSTSRENAGIDPFGRQPDTRRNRKGLRHRIARLPISTKLLVGYLAFVFPVAVLVVFMDSGFARDLRAVRREIGGIEYARRVLEVHHLATDLQISEILNDRNTGTASDAGRDLEQLRGELTGAMSDLLAHHEATAEALGLSTTQLAERGLADISAPAIASRLKSATDTGAPVGPDLIAGLLRLSDSSLNLTGVTQDPALDSNALIRAVFVHLPELQRVVGDALISLASYDGRDNERWMQMHAMALETYSAVLRVDTGRHIASLIDLALREDGRFFNEHVEVQESIREATNRFVGTASAFVALLATRADGTSTLVERAVVAGMETLDASATLFNEGVSGIRELVSDRPERLTVLRVAAAASSATALLLVALLVMWISRSIHRSVNGIIGFTRKVARGDFAATLNEQLPDDLYELYGHTKSMLDDIVTLAEFPRQNPNGVLAVGADGEVIYRNPSVQQFMDERGVELEQLLPVTHRDVVARLMEDRDQSQRLETSGDGYVLEWTYNPVNDRKLVHLYFTDVTERKRAEEQLIHDSFHDSLTGLANRALFADRLQQTIAATDSESTYTFAVFLLDLDRFKVINESLGPDHGDELLKVVADRLRAVTRPQDTVARFGGDEFAVLLPNLDDSREALHVAGRIHEVVRQAVTIEGEQFAVTCSIGIVFPGNDRRVDGALRRDPHIVQRDPQAILRDADTAMYSAKSNGKARSEIFNSSMYEGALSSMRLENELARAVKNGEIISYYQPIVSLETGRIAGFEALARWLHPERGMIGPGTFVPLAEETGLIVELGEHILKEAVAHTCRWRNDHREFETLTVSVNLSVHQFGHPGLTDDIRQVLESAGMDARCLKLEITESGLMQNVETSLDLLTRLKRLDITLGIDDFGTGYSSLSYLHRFPFDTLKVDQSFVGRMEEEKESRAIVTNVLSLAHGLGKEAVAEGIETEGQLLALRQLHAEYGQGYLFAAPLPAADAGDLLSANPQW